MNILFNIVSSLKIYKGLDSFTKLKNAVITTGTFDGVHLGHVELINELCQTNKDQESVLITFYPHPRLVLFPDQKIKFINSFDEKINLLSNFNIDHLIIHEFDLEFSRTTSIEYIRDILKAKIGLNKLIIGHDHHFGRNREASLDEINDYSKLYDFEIKSIPPFIYNDKVISSTKIRNALNNGDVELANEFLGYKFHFQGKILRGKGLGRKIGFPTANISLDHENKIIPAHGVYAANVEYKDKKYKGMLNIGLNPTFEEKKLSIELNIFDFREDIYENEIKIFVEKKIRNEQKFESIDELKNQLQKDEIIARKLLLSLNN